MNIPEGEIQVICDVLQSSSELPAEVNILTFWSDILFISTGHLKIQI